MTWPVTVAWLTVDVLTGDRTVDEERYRENLLNRE